MRHRHLFAATNAWARLSSELVQHFCFAMAIGANKFKWHFSVLSFGPNELVVRGPQQGHIRYLGSVLGQQNGIKVILQVRYMVGTWKHVVA